MPQPPRRFNPRGIDEQRGAQPAARGESSQAIQVSGIGNTNVEPQSTLQVPQVAELVEIMQEAIHSAERRSNYYGNGFRNFAMQLEKKTIAEGRKVNADELALMLPLIKDSLKFTKASTFDNRTIYLSKLTRAGMFEVTGIDAEQQAELNQIKMQLFNQNLNVLQDTTQNVSLHSITTFFSQLSYELNDNELVPLDEAQFAGLKEVMVKSSQALARYIAKFELHQINHLLGAFCRVADVHENIYTPLQPCIEQLVQRYDQLLIATPVAERQRVISNLNPHLLLNTMGKLLRFNPNPSLEYKDLLGFLVKHLPSQQNVEKAAHSVSNLFSLASYSLLDAQLIQYKLVEVTEALIKRVGGLDAATQIKLFKHSTAFFSDIDSIPTHLEVAVSSLAAFYRRLAENINHRLQQGEVPNHIALSQCLRAIDSVLIKMPHKDTYFAVVVVSLLQKIVAEKSRFDLERLASVINRLSNFISVRFYGLDKAAFFNQTQLEYLLAVFNNLLATSYDMLGKEKHISTTVLLRLFRAITFLVNDDHFLTPLMHQTINKLLTELNNRKMQLSPLEITESLHYMAILGDFIPVERRIEIDFIQLLKPEQVQELLQTNNNNLLWSLLVVAAKKSADTASYQTTLDELRKIIVFILKRSPIAQTEEAIRTRNIAVNWVKGEFVAQELPSKIKISKAQHAAFANLQQKLPEFTLVEEHAINHLAPVDIMLPEHRVAIEVNGFSHYIDTERKKRTGNTILKQASYAKQGYKVFNLVIGSDGISEQDLAQCAKEIRDYISITKPAIVFSNE